MAKFAGSRESTAGWFLLLAGLTATGCSDGKAASGLVVVGADVHHFGKCGQKELLSHTFELLNETESPVRIDGISSSCTCLVADELGPTTIHPGGRFLLPVHFTTGAAQETASGRVDVAYDLVSEKTMQSDQRRFVRLLVHADVMPEYWILPREIDFGVIDGLEVERIRRTVRVVPEAADAVQVREVTCSSQFLKAQLLPKPPNDDTSQIDVVLDLSGLAHNRSINGIVHVTTDNQTLPKAIVRARADYQAPAEAGPHMIVIGSDEQGEVERQIRLTTTRPARIVNVRSSPETGRIRVEHDREQFSRQQQLQLSIAPCPDVSLDCELAVLLELHACNGERVVRTVKVPVHRLPHNGEPP